MALSSVVRAARALPAAVMDRLLMPRPEDVMLLPSMLIRSVWPPKWIDTLAELSSILMPLKSVASAIRVISLAISLNSLSIITRWAEEYEPVAACSANCCIRTIRSSTVCRAPSMVCSRLTPSIAFRCPCSNTAMSARISSRTAIPAASSLALLMRKPDDSLSTDVAKAS